ncbi:DNA-3-methyladenine glycosylase (plasmid) [Nicoliella spurrieriana]|uniref:Putative 3-methyladenine DNA glycosylase n=1 Tax=Nicoliella spurrieriana TaxID=2925830 RepID=A0A976RQS8_9LACO|nr:DNA-3-methyladenine glycosylase [Nicoliella spurrieriana]UQS86093.1 DNA-3-methyladenine glycosylase [Nicoliella spurrieriana]
MLNQQIEFVRAFFDHQPTEKIAENCLGRKLIYDGPHGTVAAYIVEAEAYLGQNDSTAHAYHGRRTASNEPLYGEPGTVYIYSIHGRYLFDVVTQPKDVPQGILIRAGQPCDGIAIMEQNRNKHGVNLTNGPGKLMEAFGIHDMKMNQQYVNDCPIRMDLNHRLMPERVVASSRIGVNQSGPSANSPLRFYVAGNPYVSGMLKRDRLKNNGWKNN